MNLNTSIKVMLVEDSFIIREILKRIIDKEEGMEVITEAENPLVADRLLNKYSPDILILDLNMPEMDGLTFLQILMQKKPMPVIVFSSITNKGSVNIDKAFQLGATEVFSKPNRLHSIGSTRYQLIHSIRGIIRLNTKKYNSTRRFRSPKIKDSVAKEDYIFIGASTGGTRAIREILMSFPNFIPPVCISLHMPAKFSKPFAEQLNEICPFTVKEAKNGDFLKENQVLIAPGDHHMEIDYDPHALYPYYVKLNNEDREQSHRPSIDLLFSSAAKWIGAQSIGIILTGMGNDGAKGLLDMRKKGAVTLSQNKATSSIYGMPKEAMRIGASQKSCPLYEIASEIFKKCPHKDSLIR